MISNLICYFDLEFDVLEHRYGIHFESYFAPEMERLRRMQDDGLLVIGQEQIEVLPKGRLLIRAICMVFDRYLAEAQSEPRFSKVI